MLALPMVFLDRSLGRIQVPRLLRAAGIELVTLAERRALEVSRARCFCLANGYLSGAVMAQRYIANLDAITRVSTDPGPFVFAVHANRLERLH